MPITKDEYIQRRLAGESEAQIDASVSVFDSDKGTYKNGQLSRDDYIKLRTAGYSQNDILGQLIRRESSDLSNSYNRSVNRYNKDSAGGWRSQQNSAAYLQDTQREASSMRERADRIRNLLDQYDTDDETRKSVEEFLKGTESGTQGISDYAKNSFDYWGQFKDEGEYNTYKDMQGHYTAAKNAGQNTMQWYDISKRSKEDADAKYNSARAKYDEMLNYYDLDGTFQGQNMDPAYQKKLDEAKAELEQAAKEKYAAAQDFGYADSMRFNDWSVDANSTAAGKTQFDIDAAQHEKDVAAAREKDYEDYLWGGAGDLGYQESLAKTYGYDLSELQPADDWTQEQKDRYYSIYSEDTQLAGEYALKINQQNANQKYYDAINNAEIFGVNVMDLMEREEGKWGHNIATGALGLAAGVATSPVQLFDYLDMMAQLAGQGVVMQKADPLLSDYAQEMVGKRAADLNEQVGTIQSGVFEGKGWGDVYQLGESILQSLTYGAIGGEVAGALISSMTFFGTAAKQGLQDALDRGVAPKEAMLYSIAVGANEALFEYFSMDKLVHMANPKDAAAFFRQLLVQGFIEGSEEFNTSLANSLAQEVFLKDKTDIEISIQKYMAQGMSYDRAKKQAVQDWSRDLANDFIGGFISGGVSGMIKQGGGLAVSSMTSYTKDAARQYRAQGMSAEQAQAKALADRQQMFDLSAEAGGDTAAYGKSLQEITEQKNRRGQNKDISVRQAQKLRQGTVDALSASDIANTVTAVEARMEELGQSDPKLAQAIAAVALEGEAERIGARGVGATKAQQDLVKSNPVAQRILSEMDVENLRNERLAGFNAFVQNRQSGATKEDYDRAVAPYQRSNEWVKTMQQNKALASDVYGAKTVVTQDEKTGKVTFTNKGGNSINGQIVGVSDGKVRIKHGKDGKYIQDVEISQIKGISAGYRQLLQAAASRKNGSVLLAQYKAGQDINSYLQAWDLAENYYGVTNLTAEKARNAFALRELTDAQLKMAMDLGRSEAKKSGTTEARQQKVTGELSFWNGGEIEGTEYDATSAEEAKKLLGDAEYSFLTDVMSKVVNVTLVKSKEVNGSFTGAQGIFFRDGRVYFDVNAGMNSAADVGQRTIVLTAAHELTHYIRAYNEDAYKALRDFVAEELVNQGKNLEDLIDQKIKRSGYAIDEDEAMEEVVADACEMMLTDAQQISAFASQHEAEARGIWKWLDKFFTRVENAFSGLTARHEEAKAMQGRITELRQMWLDALAGANANAMAREAADPTDVVTEVKTDTGFTAAVQSDTTSMMSLRTFDESGRANLDAFLNQQVQKGALTKEEAQQMRTQIEEMYKVCKEYDNGEYVPFSAWSNAEVVSIDGKPVFSVVKQNGEYKLNLDFSLVCKKRRTLDAVFNEMIRRGIMNDFRMGQGSIAKINQIIREHGFETACGLCFVDSKRYRQAMIADAFCKMYNMQVMSLLKKDAGMHLDFFNFGGDETIHNSGKGIDTLPDSALNWTKIDEILKTEKKGTVKYKIAEYLKNNPSQRKLVSRGDFMSTKGFDSLKINDQELLSLYNSKKGAGGPKAAQSDVQYLNEIIQQGQFNAKAAYAVGGIRIQSFSDYVGRLVFDYVQMVADLSAKKLPAHSYTKEFMFAQQFGLTGIKINMSLVPEVVKGGVAPGLDKDGNYAWKDGQSFGSTVYDNKGKRLTAAEGFELAKKIQNAEGYSKNCGTIAVGVSKAHIDKMLDDPEIRMIIPYHKSGLNHLVAAMEQIDKYTDYTNEQNTRAYKNGKWSKISPSEEFNWNDTLQQMQAEGKGAREAADAYLAWCREHGYKAKFDEFAGHPNYYKLLEDFSCYDKDGTTSTPLGAVQMNFPTEADAFGSMKDLIKAGLDEDAMLQAKQEGGVDDIVNEIQSVLPEWEAAHPEGKKGKHADRDRNNPISETVKKIEDAKAVRKKALGIIREVIANKGSGRAKEVTGLSERLVDMVARASGNAIDISEKQLGINPSLMYHAYIRHSDQNAETSRDQIAVTDEDLAYATAVVNNPDVVECIYPDANNPTQNASFAYAKRMPDGCFVVAEIVSGNNKKFIFPTEIHKFTEAKWKKMMAEGKTMGEIMYKDKPKLLAALDSAANKKNRVIAAQYVIKDPAFSAFSSVKKTITQAEKKIKKKFGLHSERDAAYSAAVESNDMDKAAHLVNQAAKDAGAILNKSGRGALHLYHGTPSFGFTEFRPGMIFLTDNKSIAAGYTQNKGYGRPRQISEAYTPDDGSAKTLIKNLKNVLGHEYREVTKADVNKLREEFRTSSGEMSEKVNDVWDGKAMDALHDILGDEYTQEFENKLYEILALPGYINEWINEIFEDPTSGEAEDIRRELERHDDYYEDVRKVISNHNKELRDSDAKDLRALIMGYDLSDFLIDAQYKMIRALDADNMLMSVTGSLVSKDRLRQDVEQTKDVGAYDLYGFAGDKPLEIDGKGAFWTNIEVPELGGVFMTDEIAREAKEKGYTSVIIHNIMDSSMNEYATNVNSDVYIFFDSNQVKSADPVTYGDDGNVIPLDERFNSEQKDIRYSDRDINSFTTKADIDAEISRVQDQIRDIQNAQWNAVETAKKDPRVQDAQQKMWAAEDSKGYSGAMKERMAYRRILKEVKEELAADAPQGDLQEMADRVNELKALREQYLKVTPITAAQYNKLAKHFGTTTDYSAAGFILKDGRMLDFSGKKQYGKAYAGGREVYHNEVGDVLNLPTDTSPRIDMVSNGNIRLVPEINGINLSQKPTAQQKDALRGFIEFNNGSVHVDIDNAAGRTIDSFGYFKNTSAAKILADIDRYFETGETPAPQSDLRAYLSLRDNAAVQKTKEHYNERLDKLRAEKNAKIDEIRKEETQRRQAAVKKEKAAKWEKVEETKEHYRGMMENQRKKRSDTSMRGKIKDLHKELNDILLKPKEGRYVPRELVKATAEILGAVDTTSGRAVKAKAALAELRVKYEALAKDPKYSLTYDETVSGMIQSLAEELGDGSIYDLTGYQLEGVYNTLKALKHTIVTANKLVGAKIEADAFEAANQMMRETEDAKGIPTKTLRRFVLAQMTPSSAFRMFGGYRKNSMWEQMFGELNRGQLTQTQILMEGGQIFRELIDDKKNMAKLHDRKNLVDIGLKDDQGNAIKVTRGMMLSVYMHLLNEQNARHVAYGGFTVPKLAAYYRNQMKDAYTGKTGRAVAFATEIAELNRQLETAETAQEKDEIKERLAELQDETDAYMSNLRAQIEKQLTEYDRKWISAAQEFFDDYSKGKLNEVTEMVYGFSKAQVDNYFPIHTDPDYRSASFDTITRDMSLENAGFMKERINGSNPILLEDITDVISSQLRRTAQYCGLMPAIRNFNKAYGKARAGYAMSVQSAMARTFETEGKKYIENLMADLNGARKTEANIFDELRGNMAGAVLTLNPRVAMAQTASFPSAAAEIGYKPLAKALVDMKNPMWNKGLQEEIAKWTPLWWYRMQGYSTTELGDIKNNEQFMNKVMEKTRWLTGWIQAMDGYATGGLWQASKYYVDENFSDLERGSEEYMMKVAETFNRVLEKTQPDYTTMQRPDILRNPNAIVKQLTMFMTQRLQNTNILYDAAATYAHYVRDAAKGRNGVTSADVKQAGTRLAWAVSSQVAAGATIVIFKALADLLMHNLKAYRDDDDELTQESVSKAILTNFIETMSGNILWGSEAFSWIKSAFTGERYYGVSLNGVDTFTDMLEDGNKMIQGYLKGNKDAGNAAAWKLGKAVSQFFGIPLGNAEKFVQMTKNHIEDAQNGTFMEAGVDRTRAQNTHILFDALQAGDKEKAERIRETFDDKKDEQAALKGYIRELYTEDKSLAKSDVIKLLMKYAGMTQRAAEDTAQEWTMEVVTGRKFSTLQDDYISGDISKAQAVKEYQTYSSNGHTTQDEAEAKILEWTCEKDTGIAYSDIGNEVKTGRIGKDRAVQMLIKYGGKSEDAADKQVEGWLIEHEFNIKPSELEDEYMAGNIDAETAHEILVRYKFNGKEDAEQKASDEIYKWDFIEDNPGTEDITVTQVRRYKNAGLEGVVSGKDFLDAYEATSIMHGIDTDGDGKANRNTRVDQQLAYIDGMSNLTSEQKTALALALGINERTIRNRAPWKKRR